ncbi:MAG: WYL domain-containing protein [bacterium]
MLFHEIYGRYFVAVSAILKEAVEGRLTNRRINQLVETYAFQESLMTIPDGLKHEWCLLYDDLSTPLLEEPAMPLTLLEKRWMKALLLDPRVQLFDPDLTGLEEIEPLFTPEMIVYYDRYTDGDHYEDPEYIKHFKTILQALSQGCNLQISFETRKMQHAGIVLTPHYLEYSLKDDRFRLIAAGRKRRWTINVGRMSECSLIEGELHPLKEPETRQVIFELKDYRNALQRVLLHFSHLEKETKRLDRHTYRVTLSYDPQDEMEMVIRLLSFGPVIKVIEPESVVFELKKRIAMQIATFSPSLIDEQDV